MPRFKVGDVVECTRGTLTRLTPGNTYEVLYSYSGGYVRILDNLGDEEGWPESRFVLATPATPATPKLTGMTQFYKDREIRYA